MQTLTSLLVIFASFSGCILLIHCQDSHEEDTSAVNHGSVQPWHGEEVSPSRPFWYPASLDYDTDSKSSEEVDYNQQFPTNSPNVNRHLDKENTASLPEIDTGIEETNEGDTLHHVQREKLYIYRTLRSVEDNSNSTLSTVENSSEESNENSTENKYHHHHHHHHYHHHHHPRGGRYWWGPPNGFHHWKHHWHFHRRPHKDTNDTSSTTENTNRERNETAVTTQDNSEIERDNANPSEGPSTPFLELEPRREETTEAGANNNDAEFLPLKALTTTIPSGIPDIGSRNALVVECKKDKNNNCQSEWK